MPPTASAVTEPNDMADPAVEPVAELPGPMPASGHPSVIQTALIDFEVCGAGSALSEGSRIYEFVAGSATVGQRSAAHHRLLGLCTGAVARGRSCRTRVVAFVVRVGAGCAQVHSDYCPGTSIVLVFDVEGEGGS